MLYEIIHIIQCSLVKYRRNVWMNCWIGKKEEIYLNLNDPLDAAEGSIERIIAWRYLIETEFMNVICCLA